MPPLEDAMETEKAPLLNKEGKQEQKSTDSYPGFLVLEGGVNSNRTNDQIKSDFDWRNNNRAFLGFLVQKQPHRFIDPQKHENNGGIKKLCIAYRHNFCKCAYARRDNF
jgi:hypothetical protein